MPYDYEDCMLNEEVKRALLIAQKNEIAEHFKALWDNFGMKLMERGEEKAEVTYEKTSEFMPRNDSHQSRNTRLIINCRIFHKGIIKFRSIIMMRNLLREPLALK